MWPAPLTRGAFASGCLEDIANPTEHMFAIVEDKQELFGAQVFGEFIFNRNRLSRQHPQCLANGARHVNRIAHRGKVDNPYTTAEQLLLCRAAVSTASVVLPTPPGPIMLVILCLPSKVVMLASSSSRATHSGR